MPSTRTHQQKRLFTHLLLVVASLIIGFALSEVLARVALEKHHLDWHYPKPLLERVDDCREKQGNVAIFGDSFVEYFRDSKSNMSQAVEKISSKLKTCNFGFWGTGLDDYLVNWQFVSKQHPLKHAVFVLFTGNDYDDYFLHFRQKKLPPQQAALPLPLQNRMQATANKSLVHFLKRSVFLTGLWRLAYKTIFQPRSISPQSLRDTNTYTQSFPLTDDLIQKRLQLIPLPIKKAVQSDLINIEILLRAVFDPHYFVRLHQGYDNYNTGVLNQLIDRVQKIQAICIEKNVQCSFVFIEPDVFTHKKHHSFYESMNYQLHKQMLTPPLLSQQLKDYFTSNGISHLETIKTLSEDPLYFIPQDGHLSIKGHEALGHLIASHLNALNNANITHKK